MAEARRDRMVRLVQEMFKLRERSSEGDRLNDAGIPLRITDLTQKIFTPETKFHVPGRGPQAFSGGIEDYFAYHAKRVRKTEDKLDLHLLDVLASDTQAAALIRYREEIAGEPFEWLRVNLFSFNEAGDRVVEVHVFEHDQYGVDRCFARAYGESDEGERESSHQL
jgi:hypothetical protein